MNKNTNTILKDFIVSEEFIKEKGKQQKKGHFEKYQHFGPEYAKGVVDDSTLCKYIIDSDLKFSLLQFHSMQNYLIQRVIRYLKRDSSYTASQFLSKLQSSAKKFLTLESSNLEWDLNAKRLLVEISLDVYRLTIYHTQFSNIEKTRKKGYDFVKFLAKTIYYNPTVLMIKVFYYGYKHHKNEIHKKLWEKFYKYRILTLDYLIDLLYTHSKEKLKKSHKKRIACLKEMIGSLTKHFPNLEKIKTQYTSKFPLLDENPLQDISVMYVYDAGDQVRKIFKTYNAIDDINLSMSSSIIKCSVPDEYLQHEYLPYQDKLSALSTKQMQLKKPMCSEYSSSDSPQEITDKNPNDQFKPPHYSFNDMRSNISMPTYNTPVYRKSSFNFGPNNNQSELSETNNEQNLECTSTEKLKLENDNSLDEIKSLSDKNEQVQFEPEMFKDTLDKVIAFDNEPSSNYKVINDTKEYKLWLKTNENVYQVKGVMTVKGLTPEECYRMLNDFEIREKWDDIMCNFQVLRKTNEFIDHIYMMILAPWPVTDRDFVQKRTKAKNYKGYDYVMHFVSDDIQEMPQRKNFVRAMTHISGYLFKQSPDDPESTIMTLIAQTDIRGMVPKSLVNYNAQRMPKKWVRDFTDKGIMLKAKGVFN